MIIEMKPVTLLPAVRKAVFIFFVVFTVLSSPGIVGADLDVRRNYEGSLFKMTENKLFGIELKIFEEEAGEGGKKAEMIIYDSSGNDVENAELTVMPEDRGTGPDRSDGPVITEKGGGFYHIDNLVPGGAGLREVKIGIKKEGVEDMVVFDVPEEKADEAGEGASTPDRQQAKIAEGEEKSSTAGTHEDYTHEDYRKILKPLPALPPIPADNTITAEKLRMGKMLYWERRASKTGTTSCASCHHPAYYGAEPLKKSVGIGSEIYLRNAPTVLNTAFMNALFWSGEAQSLEDQAFHSVKSHMEMHNLPEEVTGALNRVPEYRQLSERVFGGPLTEEYIRKAIAAYVRTLITPDYPLARWLHGDESALSDSQKKGMALFIEKGCIGCHNGPGFSGTARDRGIRVQTHEHNEATQQQLHKVVLPDAENDAGLAHTSKKDEDKYLFRVQQLLNVAMTPPYTHAGLIDNLPDMVGFMATEMLHIEISPTETQEIAAFLESLTGEMPRDFLNVPLLPAGGTE